jgi:predicted metal-binding membrane protein
MSSASVALPRERNLILGLLLTLAAAAWIVLVWQATAMNMAMQSPTMGLTAPLFLALWVVMMIAMMFPTASPMILTFHKIQTTKRERGQPFVSTWIFVAAYLVVWTLFGELAYLAATLVQVVATSTSLSPEVAARVGGLALVMAGIYQLSPLKYLCLSKCRTPLAFLLSSWKDGAGGAVRMGLEHGAYCLGCCWLLFVILFPLGMMNVAMMAIITVLIFAEKSMPLGHRISHVAAVVLVIYGGVVIALPQVLPTFMSSASIAMPDMPMPESPMPGGSPSTLGDSMPGLPMPDSPVPDGGPTMPGGSMPGM